VSVSVAVASGASRDEAADARAEVADSMTDEGSADRSEETAAEAEAAAELAAEGAASVSGMVMGTPACWQVDSTAEMAAAWSSAEHAPCTQGWTSERSAGPFLQWHAKSVRDSQPSLVRGPRKQLSCTVLVVM
jgi:hypothetical protein